MSLFLTSTTLILNSIYFCRDKSIYTIIVNIFSQLYALQSILLLALLFQRLFHVFKGTILSLSSCTITVWWTTYSITIISLIAAAIGHGSFYNEDIGRLILAIGFLMLIIDVIILKVLFLFKLKQVYSDLDCDPKLMTIATKTSLLGIFSILSTIFMSIAAVSAPPKTKSIHINFIIGSFITNDLITNFWCAILMFNQFNDCYLRICKSCDAKCRTCWFRIVGRDEVMIKQELEECQVDQLPPTTV